MKFSNIIHVIPLFTDNTIAINVYNCNSISNTLIFQYIAIYFIFYIYMYSAKLCVTDCTTAGFLLPYSVAEGISFGSMALKFYTYILSLLL